MPVREATSEETPYGRHVTSEGWFVLNLGDAPAVRNEQKGGAYYRLESREHEEEERTLRRWDYVHCPAGTRHVFVGGAEPCAVLMIGARPEQEELLYPVSEAAAKHGASVAAETTSGAEAYADWPGDYEPVRLAWPPS